MTAWSTLIRSSAANFQKIRLFQPKLSVNNALVNAIQIRPSHGMVVQPTRWQWHKTKDLCHFYLCVAIIPLGAITFFVNIFVGPATLTPIPEGYTPKYWEYYRHPITRFIAWARPSPQKEYEKCLNVIYDEGQMIKIRKLEKQVWALQAERQDYRYNHFLPYWNAPQREFREVVEKDRDNMA